MNVRHLTVLSIVSLFTTSPLLSEDWPEFRGPTGMGHSAAKDVPLEWGPRDNVKWSTEIDGVAWSSPIVVDRAVYVTTAVEEGDSLSLRVLGLRATDGEVVWDSEVLRPEKARQHKKNSQASPTPVHEDGVVYAHFGHYGTAAVDARTGEVVWTQDSLTYKPVHGTGSSPILVGDKLIYSADGGDDPKLIALDKATGAVAWQTPRGVEVERTFSFATPLAIEIDGETQVISPASGAVIAYDPDDGSEIWRAHYGEGYSVVPRPIFAEGLLFVCSGFNRASLFAIKPGGEGDVTDSHIVWSSDRQVPKESTPIVVDGILYMNADTGVATALDAATGEELWQERIAPGNYSASPVYAGGHIYFQNEDGVTTVIKPGKDLEVVATNEIGERGLSSFAVTDGAIYIRTEEHLHRIGK